MSRLLCAQPLGLCAQPITMNRSLQRGPTRPVLARAAPGPEQDGLQEAFKLYQQASELARLSTQRELEQAFASSKTDTEPLLSKQALETFFIEQGLRQVSAARLARDMHTRGMNYSANLLTAKFERWGRIIGADTSVLLELLQKDVELLEQDVNLAIMNLIQLVDTFPGKDIQSILLQAPGLLYCEDLAERKERVLGQLVRLHPSRNRDTVAAIVAENPQLLYRMDYYPNVRMIDELPIEIQNMFIIADQGLGALHRYYRRRAAAVAQAQAPQQAGGSGGPVHPMTMSSESETDEYGY